ncbi:MAG: hypothetical protein JXR12_01390 [Neptunomonas phycophila]|uniref:hypothetical protein n=1 Tax=Neptunomonas phycophila TaxID=1572645 RepID=UPI003B8D75C6
MKFFGDISLNSNKIQEMALDMEDNFPIDPPTGRVVFRQQRVYIAAETVDGHTTWIPLTNTLNIHYHTQGSRQVVWEVNHNLGTTTPMVQVYDDANQQMFIPQDITIIDNNTLRITMTVPTSGRAVVMSGEATGGNAPEAQSFTHEQTTPSDGWVINHNLGYNPFVRVFIGNEEVTPDSIIHNSITQTVVQFSTPKVGVARLV